nr:F121 [uncultured bacterium]
MSSQLPEFKLETNDLYREETITDRRVGSVRRLQPVTVDGQPDPARPLLFVGQTQIVTPMGALPLTFEIAAADLREALEKFPAGAQKALEDTARELQEMRREQASSIVVPEPGRGGLGAPAGRIQLR